MVQLTPDECRVLGVLVEKALTTPQQYPLSVNAITAGCSQKNNRDPVADYDDERVLRALDLLKAKNLAMEVHLTGSRVIKFRHTALEALGVRVVELALLAELLLRGPQTAGELRSRASRMQAFESLEVVQNVLDSLVQRPEPLVRRLPPSPGTRAERYAQLLCPEAHPLESAAAPAGADTSPAGASELAQRVDLLEKQVAGLAQRLEEVCQRVNALGMRP